jgi:ribosomal protein L11 methyltransferase
VGRGGARVIRLAVRVAREHADVVVAELLALSPGGLEELDVDERTVELAIYGAPGELPDVGSLRAAAGEALVDVSTTQVADDWHERWREWHRPIDVGPLRVRPPWAEPGALDVVIEPGQAFGTGAHATTRLTLELLAGLPAEGALADWGCGSGVLAIAAARLGFDPVLACDIERESVEATLAAAAANGIAAAGPGAAAPGALPAGIVVSRVDLRREPGPWAPTVVANLVLGLLLDVAAAMERPPERLIASGLLAGEVDEAAAAFARRGLAQRARRDADGWSAILLAR